MIQIQNLTFIHLYNKYDGNFPELKIKYDGQELIIDYANPDFLTILDQVWQEYQKNPDVIVFGKFDEEEIEKCKEMGKYEICPTYIQNSSLLNSNQEINQIKKYESYLKEIICQIIGSDKEIIFGPIHGHKNKFSLSYQLDNSQMVTTFICAFEEDKLLFKTTYIGNQVVPITGEIEIKNDRVYINWISSDKELSGTIIHSIEDENEKSIHTKNETIKAEVSLNTTKKEQELIEFYLQLSGLGQCRKIQKATENTYLFLTLEDENTQTCTITSGHITITQNRVIINTKKGYGPSLLKQYLFIPVESYSVETIIIPVDKNHLIMEHYFPKNKTSTCIQKSLEGTYSYELIEADYETLTQPFEYKKYEFTKELNNLDDLNTNETKKLSQDKQLIKRREGK